MIFINSPKKIRGVEILESGEGPKDPVEPGCNVDVMNSLNMRKTTPKWAILRYKMGKTIQPTRFPVKTSIICFAMD